MGDYLYSIAMQANSLHNNMANKTVWRINEYSLYDQTWSTYTELSLIYCNSGRTNLADFGKLLKSLACAWMNVCRNDAE